MKTKSSFYGNVGILLCITVLITRVVQGADYYVAPSGNDTQDGTSWELAKQTIQAGVDATVAGDTVWVTNGIYSTGGRVATNQTCTNRVVVDKAVTVRSVNGPAVTTITGSTNLNIRCVWLAANATLDGFTVKEGRAAGMDTYGYGGGIYCDAQYEIVLVTNCVITENSAPAGGGACRGTFYNCVFTKNIADDFSGGGGAIHSYLYNCTLCENTGVNRGGAAADSHIFNAVITSNTAGSGGGTYNCMISWSELSYNQATDGCGGGADSVGSSINECRIVGNSAVDGGGGVNEGYVYNSFIADNRARSGGGINHAQAWNTTIVGNRAIEDGGGANYSIVNNCIIYYNEAPQDPNISSMQSVMTSNCIQDCADTAGVITNAPLLAGLNNFHIMEGSPCIDRGYNVYLPSCSYAYDLDGEMRTNNLIIDIGADEVWPDALSGALGVAIRPAYTSVVEGCTVRFDADVSGKPCSTRWQVEDGSFLYHAPLISRTFATAGVYTLSFSATNIDTMASDAVEIQVVESFTNFVSFAGSHTPPYITWETAATNIQDAIDACPAGGTVLVAPGTYDVGASEINGAASRVMAVKPLRIIAQSDDPAQTVIAGAGPLGSNAVRCVYLVEGAELTGFTLTNGFTRLTGFREYSGSGGGAWCEPGAVLSNCVVSGCQADYYGGGVYDGTLYNCEVLGNKVIREDANNESVGGGLYNADTYYCLVAGNTATGMSGWQGYGGGAGNGAHYRTVFTNNQAGYYGGGLYHGEATQCSFVNNECSRYGGGAFGITGYECEIMNNAAGAQGGGVSGCTLTECMLTGNESVAGGGTDGGHLTNCLVRSNVATIGGGTHNTDAFKCELNGNTARDGGGAYGGNLENCTIISNVAREDGGGITGCRKEAITKGVTGIAINCFISGNMAESGGGADDSQLINCTVINNDAHSGGGISGSVATNSIVYYNRAIFDDPNYACSELVYSCALPLPEGTGNVAHLPGLAALNNPHLLTNSLCIQAGATNVITTDYDIDGEPRVQSGQVDMGCDEVWISGLTGSVSVAVNLSAAVLSTTYPVEASAEISGRPARTQWGLG